MIWNNSRWPGTVVGDLEQGVDVLEQIVDGLEGVVDILEQIADSLEGVDALEHVVDNLDRGSRWSGHR